VPTRITSGDSSGQGDGRGFMLARSGQWPSGLWHGKTDASAMRCAAMPGASGAIYRTLFYINPTAIRRCKAAWVSRPLRGQISKRGARAGGSAVAGRALAWMATAREGRSGSGGTEERVCVDSTVAAQRRPARLTARDLRWPALRPKINLFFRACRPMAKSTKRTMRHGRRGIGSRRGSC
jgi:hypothetical protein